MTLRHFLVTIAGGIRALVDGDILALIGLALAVLIIVWSSGVFDRVARDRRDRP